MKLTCLPLLLVLIVVGSATAQVTNYQLVTQHAGEVIEGPISFSSVSGEWVAAFIRNEEAYDLIVIQKYLDGSVALAFQLSSVDAKTYPYNDSEAMQRIYPNTFELVDANEDGTPELFFRLVCECSPALVHHVLHDLKTQVTTSLETFPWKTVEDGFASAIIRVIPPSEKDVLATKLYELALQDDFLSTFDKGTTDTAEIEHIKMLFETKELFGDSREVNSNEFCNGYSVSIASVKHSDEFVNAENLELSETSPYR